MAEAQRQDDSEGRAVGGRAGCTGNSSGRRPAGRHGVVGHGCTIAGTLEGATAASAEEPCWRRATALACPQRNIVYCKNVVVPGARCPPPNRPTPTSPRASIA